MRRPEFTERDGGWTGRLRKAGERRIGDLPRLGEVKSEEIVG